MRISNFAYELELPLELAAIYPVFHILKLLELKIACLMRRFQSRFLMPSSHDEDQGVCFS